MATAIDWDRLYAFRGYGPEYTPKVLFLGLEEKAVDGIKNLFARASFQQIEDLHEAHQKLELAGCCNPFAYERGNPVQQWNTAARFTLALEGEALVAEK